MLWTLHYVCQKPYCIVSGPEIPIDAKPVQVVGLDALRSAISDELALHDNTGDPFDEGYKQALADVEAILAAALSEEREP